MTGSPITPAAPGTTKPTASSGQIVQIVSLPEGLQNNARALRIEGEVVQQNNDGSTRIKTPQGDMDVTIRGRQLQPGTKVEVDIPVGNPPRNVTVRPAPAQPAAPAPAPQTPPTTTQPAPQPLPQPHVQEPQVRPLPNQPPATPPPVTTQPGTTTGNATAPPPTTPTPPLLDGAEASQGKAPTATAQPATPQLPQLKAGVLITLLPEKIGTPVPDGNGGSTQQKLGVAQSNGDTPLSILPKATNALMNNLFQAVKSILPQGQPITPPILANTSTAPAATTPGLQASATIPAQPAGIQAQVLSIALPSGQTLTVAQPPMSAMVQTPQAGTIAFPASAITVTVTQFTPQNQPLIPVPINNSGTIQNFILQAPPASVPAGTQITLLPQLQTANIPPQIMSNGIPTLPVNGPMPATGLLPPTSLSTLPPAWRALLPVMQPSTLWPVMDELFQSFYQATPQAAQILGRTIPSPANPQNFGPSLMLFAAALKSGDLQGWLGEKKLEMVQKLGKDSLLSRLSSESSSIGSGNDTAATEWKSFPIPVLWQNEISKILFHVRREPAEDKDQNAEGGTRFVLDLSLSRMGNVQLDGILNDKRLDMIVRTQMAVSLHMQEAMKKAYADALDGSGIYGELGFQGDLKAWVNVLKKEEAISESL